MKEEIYKKLFEVNSDFKFFNFYKVLFKDEHHFLLEEVYAVENQIKRKHLVKVETMSSYILVKN